MIVIDGFVLALLFGGIFFGGKFIGKFQEKNAAKQEKRLKDKLEKEGYILIKKEDLPLEEKE